MNNFCIEFSFCYFVIIIGVLKIKITQLDQPAENEIKYHTLCGILMSLVGTIQQFFA